MTVNSWNLPRLGALFTQEQMETAVLSGMPSYVANTEINNFIKTLADSVYFMFSEVIPYNYESSDFVSYFSNQIAGITSVYSASILKWVTANIQQMTYIEQLIKQQTYNRTETMSSEKASQDTGLNQTSYNPLTSDIDVPVNALKPAELGSFQGANTTIVKTTGDNASYTTETNAGNSSSNFSRSVSSLDMNTYSNLQIKPETYLKDYFSKIRTLFWIFSDDFSTNGNGGINVW